MSNWLPSLSDYEMTNLDDYESNPTGGRIESKHSSPAFVRTSIGCFCYCWCGEPYLHDWPGKSEGAPHPRGK